MDVLDNMVKPYYNSNRNGHRKEGIQAGGAAGRAGALVYMAAASNDKAGVYDRIRVRLPQLPIEPNGRADADR